MEGAGDIGAVSIPFAAGVASASLMLGRYGAAAYPSAAVSCTVSAILLCQACRSGKRTVWTVLLFFALGFLCRTNAFLNPGRRLQVLDSGLPAECLGFLKARIAALGFSRESTTSLLCALLTGDRSGLAPATVKAFRDSGAAHILALSGLHLGVIYAILSKLLSLLGNSRAAKLTRSALIILFSAFYTLMTATSPSLVRAFLFILLNELSRLSPSRERGPLSVFCSALTLQLLFNPEAIDSVGFQLSYLSLLGILTIFPRLRDWYPSAQGSERYDPMRKIWSAMALSISCQLLTAPLVWFHFHSFPKYFLLTNLIALPLTEGLMVSAVIALLLSTTFGNDGGIAAQLTELLAEGLQRCLELISTM